MVKNVRFSSILWNKLQIYPFTKRLSDILISAVLLLALLPLIIFLSLLIVVRMGENPFYIQRRSLSLRHSSFRLIKLRTLKTGHLLKEQTAENSDSVLIKHRSENLVPGLGRWMRTTGIDEVPQLLNILSGSMSLIGPRPLSIEDLNTMKREFPGLYRRRECLKSKPGITGCWQILGDRQQGLENLLRLDEFYEKKKSFSLDIYLVIKTIPVVLLRRHSDAIVFSGRKCHRFRQGAWGS